MANESTEPVVRQATISLPYLGDEVPALYLTNGRPYIPVFAVCQVLGIDSEARIQHWQKLTFWTTSLKLPFQTDKRGEQLFWCLTLSQVPYLYSLFDWETC